MHAATSRPLSISHGAGHQIGGESNRSFGRVVKMYCCSSATSFRKKYATTATGMPRRAPKSNRAT